MLRAGSMWWTFFYCLIGERISVMGKAGWLLIRMREKMQGRWLCGRLLYGLITGKGSDRGKERITLLSEKASDTNIRWRRDRADIPAAVSWACAVFTEREIEKVPAKGDQSGIEKKVWGERYVWETENDPAGRLWGANRGVSQKKPFIERLLWRNRDEEINVL